MLVEGDLSETDRLSFTACAALVVAVAGLAVLASGCGGGKERASTLRPPATINVAAVIGEERVSVSPRKIGAGPIQVIASNQSSASHKLMIDGPQVRQSIGPINPEDTATLRVAVKPGEYTISADGSSGVGTGRLQVGPKRPSAQNQLLLP
jgi:hypothetical protein